MRFANALIRPWILVVAPLAVLGTTTSVAVAQDGIAGQAIENASVAEDASVDGDRSSARDAAAAWLPPLRPAETARIQNRRYTKTARGHVAIGAEYLARGDFHVSPGVVATGAWFFNEYWAVELGVSRYFAFLDPLAADVRERTGFVPDSRAPHWLFRTGARLSAGYGKVLVLGQVMHFEPQLFARASLLLSDGFPSPGGEVGVGLHVHLSRELHLRFDVSAFPHAERRTKWVPVFGVVPSLSIGFGAP